MKKLVDLVYVYSDGFWQGIDFLKLGWRSMTGSKTEQLRLLSRDPACASCRDPNSKAVIVHGGTAKPVDKAPVTHVEIIKKVCATPDDVQAVSHSDVSLALLADEKENTEIASRDNSTALSAVAATPSDPVRSAPIKSKEPTKAISVRFKISVLTRAREAVRRNVGPTNLNAFITQAVCEANIRLLGPPDPEDGGEGSDVDVTRD